MIEGDDSVFSTENVRKQGVSKAKDWYHVWPYAEEYIEEMATLKYTIHMMPSRVPSSNLFYNGIWKKTWRIKIPGILIADWLHEKTFFFKDL